MSDLGSESKKYYLKMKYQERQFLRARDFQDEQDYHIAKIKNHNRTLHSRGVCEGMEVTKSSKDYCVDVKPGTAIDFDGNPILLTETETVDLRNFSTGVTNIVLTMRYGESNSPDRQHNLDEGGFTGCTRTMEKPIFEASPASSSSSASPVDTNPNRLVLAKIVRDTSGLIKTVDDSTLSGRLKAGVQYADVTTADLLPKSVTTAKIADGAVTAEKIAPNTITSYQMGSGSVNSGAIQSSAVTSEKLSVTSTANKTLAAVANENIRDGAVTAIKLATGPTQGAVDSDVIRTNAVTTIKIKDGAVTSEKLEKLDTSANTKGAVATSNIQNYAVTSDKLASALNREAVATVNIQNYAVTNLKLAVDAVTASKVKDGSLPLNKISFTKQFNMGVSIRRGKDDASSTLEFNIIERPLDYFSNYPTWTSMWITGTDKGVAIPSVAWYTKVRPNTVKNPTSNYLVCFATVSGISEGDTVFCRFTMFRTEP